jgi:hypothetical protein
LSMAGCKAPEMFVRVGVPRSKSDEREMMRTPIRSWSVQKGASCDVTTRMALLGRVREITKFYA